jgi:hypothetical protein
MKILILAGPSSLPHLNALRQANHQVLVCERLEEAEAVLYAHAETIDLIWLSDKEGPSAARLNPMGLGFFQALQADPTTANIPVVLSADGWSQKEVEVFAKGARLPHGLMHGQLTPERVLEAFQEVVVTSMPEPPEFEGGGEVEFQKLEIEIPGLAPPPQSPIFKVEEKKEALSEIKPSPPDAPTRFTLIESDTLLKPVPLIEVEPSIRFEPFEEKSATPAAELSMEQAEAVLEEALSFDLSLAASKSQLMEEDIGLLNSAQSIQPAGNIPIEPATEEPPPHISLDPLPELAPPSVGLELKVGDEGLHFDEPILQERSRPQAKPPGPVAPSAGPSENERALEHRLDLCMRDASAKLRVREQKLLELQRRLDMAEFNVEMLNQALQKERDRAEALESKLQKVMRLLNSVSEGSESGLGFP